MDGVDQVPIVEWLRQRPAWCLPGLLAGRNASHQNAGAGRACGRMFVQDEHLQAVGLALWAGCRGGLPQDLHAPGFEDGPQDLGRFAQTINDNDFGSSRHGSVLVRGAAASGDEQNVLPAGVPAGLRRGRGR